MPLSPEKQLNGGQSTGIRNPYSRQYQPRRLVASTGKRNRSEATIASPPDARSSKRHRLNETVEPASNVKRALFSSNSFTKVDGDSVMCKMEGSSVMCKVDGTSVMGFPNLWSCTNKDLMLRHYDFVEWLKRMEANSWTNLKEFLKWTRSEEGKTLEVQAGANETFPYGKYRGKTFSYVAAKDPQYHLGKCDSPALVRYKNWFNLSIALCSGREDQNLDDAVPSLQGGLSQESSDLKDMDDFNTTPKEEQGRSLQPLSHELLSPVGVNEAFHQGLQAQHFVEPDWDHNSALGTDTIPVVAPHCNNQTNFSAPESHMRDTSSPTTRLSTSLLSEDVLRKPILRSQSQQFSYRSRHFQTRRDKRNERAANQGSLAFKAWIIQKLSSCCYIVGSIMFTLSCHVSMFILWIAGLEYTTHKELECQNYNIIDDNESECQGMKVLYGRSVMHLLPFAVAIVLKVVKLFQRPSLESMSITLFVQDFLCFVAILISAMDFFIDIHSIPHHHPWPSTNGSYVA